MDLQVELGIDLDTTITVVATVGDGAISGAYVKLFLPVDSDPRSNARTTVRTFETGVQIERRYDLPTGSPPRIEVDITSGGSAIAVSVSAYSTGKNGSTVPVSVAGISGETQALVVTT